MPMSSWYVYPPSCSCSMSSPRLEYFVHREHRDMTKLNLAASTQSCRVPLLRSTTFPFAPVAVALDAMTVVNRTPLQKYKRWITAACARVESLS